MTCSTKSHVAALLVYGALFLLIPPNVRCQSPELILDRIDQGKLNLLASQTAQKIREAPLEEVQPSILVIDFFGNSVGTSSRMGSLLADHFSESIAAYSNGLRIIDRKTLQVYLTKEWTTLEDLKSKDVCLRIGRQLGATGIILGTLTEDKDSIDLTLSIEGVGYRAKIDDPFPWRGRNASFLRTGETHRLLYEPGPSYARTADEIPAEPGIVRAGSPGVEAPVCIYCPMPDFSDAARAAKYQGTVRLSVVVTAEGQVTSIYVLKGAPLGLTAQATNAARHWRFTPAQKDGKPLYSRVEVETTFSLY